LVIFENVTITAGIRLNDVISKVTAPHKGLLFMIIGHERRFCNNKRIRMNDVISKFIAPHKVL
jgi:hypothetical protein